ncbi:unnamed protein product, partial [marine sediment metagenome]
KEFLSIIRRRETENKDYINLQGFDLKMFLFDD